MSANVAVIIVNYRTPELAIRAVDSVLEREHGGRNVEIHLVDNASPGDDVARFRDVGERWGGRVTLWPETKNHGFGRGNNVVLKALAARAEPPEYVFLLNPDAQLDNETIDILVRALDADPGAAAAGSGICNMSSTPMTAAFRFPTLMSEMLRAANFGPLDRLFPRHSISLPPDHPEGPVNWVAAAAVLFRLTALRKVGYFDNFFFLYYEEVELMHRLARAGWRTLYIPEAQVRHVSGAATGGGGHRRDRPFYLYDSWRHYFTLTKGRSMALVIGLMIIPAAGLNVLHCRLRRRTPTVPVHFLRNHWRLVLRPLLGLGAPN